MRPILILLPMAILAACATPREQCINDANQSTRVLGQLVAQTEANLARGYALDTVQDVRTIRTTCQGRTEEGVTFTFPCEETQTFQRSVPVAIDLNAEQAKLASLQDRLARQQAAANAAISQCIATYPE